MKKRKLPISLEEGLSLIRPLIFKTADGKLYVGIEVDGTFDKDSAYLAVDEEDACRVYDSLAEQLDRMPNSERIIIPGGVGRA